VNDAVATPGLARAACLLMATTAAVLTAAVLKRMFRGRHSRKKMPTNTW
jgi:hypothetical protein